MDPRDHMSLWSRTFAYDCELPPEQAREAVRNSIGTWGATLNPLSGPLKPFLGKLEDGEFRLRPVSRWRRNRAVALQGNIRPGPRGSRIFVKVQVPRWIFLLVGLSLLVMGLTGAVVLARDPGRYPGYVGAFLLMDAAIVFGAITFAFATEGRRGQQRLMEVLPPIAGTLVTGQDAETS